MSCVHLVATTGNEEFYQNLGLKKAKTGMARYLSANLSDAYLGSVDFTNIERIPEIRIALFFDQ